MKQILVIIIFLFHSVLLYSQDISYGLLINNSYKYLEIKNSDLLQPAAGTQNIVVKFGGYGEYNFNDKIGFKVNLIFGKIKDTYFVSPSTINSHKEFFSSKTTEIDGIFKYSLNRSYREGTYLMFGGKMVLVSDTSNSISLDNIYKSSNYGIQFGIGRNIFKHFQVELIGFQGLGKYLKIEGKNYYVSGMINLVLNLESVIKSK